VGSQEKLGEIRPMDLLATSQVGLVTEVVSVYARNTENIIKAVQSGVKHSVIWWMAALCAIEITVFSPRETRHRRTAGVHRSTGL
jgi:hypothetical protein